MVTVIKAKNTDQVSHALGMPWESLAKAAFVSAYLLILLTGAVCLHTYTVHYAEAYLLFSNLLLLPLILLCIGLPWLAITPLVFTKTSLSLLDDNGECSFVNSTELFLASLQLTRILFRRARFIFKPTRVRLKRTLFSKSMLKLARSAPCHGTKTTAL